MQYALVNGVRDEALSARRVCAQRVGRTWSLNVAHESFTIGLIERDGIVIRGGKTKQTGTESGKVSFLKTAARFTTKPKMGRYTERT